MDATRTADVLSRLASLERLYGRKLVAALQRPLDVLRTRERKNAHGNRELFLSDLFVAPLLAFHLPIVRSLRTLEALRHTPVAQKRLTVERLPRSTTVRGRAFHDPATASLRARL
jgi:hypothetical protein